MLSPRVKNAAAPKPLWNTRQLPNYKVEVDQIGAAAWTAIIQQFDDANIYQTWEYEAVRFGEGRASHLVVRDGDRVVAAAQVRIVQIPLLKAGIAYVYRGPMWRRRGEESPDPDVLRKTVRALRQEYAHTRGLLLKVVPGEIASDDNPARAIFEEEGFCRDESVVPYRTFLLDLAPSLDTLRKNLRSDWRTHLNRACERPFEIVSGTGDGLYAQFLDLYHQMHARKRFVRYVDVNEFREIQKRLPDALKMRLTVCSLDGEPVTGALLATLGNTAMGVFLGTSHKSLKVQGANRLIWEQITATKELGFRYLDLGGIDPEANPGGYRFKRGLSGDDIQYIGQYVACDSVKSRAIVGAIERVRRRYRKARAWVNLKLHPKQTHRQ